MKLTIEYAKECLDYNPETGNMMWKKRPVTHFKKEQAQKRWNRMYENKQAGSINKRNYQIIVINCISYRSHRLAWLLATDHWPKDQIDHINKNRGDNRLVNLREATRSQNCQNSKKRNDNTSGVKGVSWNEKSKKWKAALISDHKNKEKSFSCLEQAEIWMNQIRDEFHKSFASH